MSQIRRQSIISTLIIFIGFFIGFINNLFFTNKSSFTEAEFGLTRSFFDFGQLIFAFSFLGLTSAMYKFAPYYKAHLKEKDNDLLSWSLLFATIGFVFFCGIAYLFKDIFIRKFIAKSPELVNYYFWIFPFAYFLLVFSFLESYLWTKHKSIVSNFLREVVLRFYHLILILLFLCKVISYNEFILFFVFTYAVLSVIIIIYLKYKKSFFITFKTSIVTKKFRKKIFAFSAFVYGGIVISTLAMLNDSFTISSFIGQAAIGIFALTTYISNIIQVPQRSVIAVTIPVLAEAWREKNLALIQKIYTRSSINLLLIGLIVFGIIWLSYDDAIKVLQMNESYSKGKYLFLLLGFKVVLDMGTGVNGQIIGTSSFWRFEFFTGIILLLLIAPLNYFLIKEIGLVGAGLSNLVAYAVYNTIRILFLWKKYKMQPFSLKTLYSLVLSIAFYFGIYFLCFNLNGWVGILTKSFLYGALMIAAIAIFKLTPDFFPVLETIKKRLKKLKSK